MKAEPLFLLAHTPGDVVGCRGSTKRFRNSPAILSPYLGLHSLSFSPLPGSRRGEGPEISCERLLHSTFLVAEEILYSGDFLLPVTSIGTKGPKAEQVPEQGKELGLTCPGDWAQGEDLAWRDQTDSQKKLSKENPTELKPQPALGSWVSTLISGTEILDSGFLSNMRVIKSFKKSVTSGLWKEEGRDEMGKGMDAASVLHLRAYYGPSGQRGWTPAPTGKQVWVLVHSSSPNPPKKQNTPF